MSDNITNKGGDELKEMVKVMYIPVVAKFRGNIGEISSLLSDLNNDDTVVRWNVEYITSTGTLTGAIITLFYEVEDGGLNYV